MVYTSNIGLDPKVPDPSLKTHPWPRKGPIKFTCHPIIEPFQGTHRSGDKADMAADPADRVPLGPGGRQR
ncbi:hypothetical protein GCM10023235_78910 [Kitasatospora terrestris]|uniref:Uncharacterized protein n=1 Tax=Kitasatospora terrestris TaxID=258051 RepID=A0ABP9ES17_9ACTN